MANLNRKNLFAEMQVLQADLEKHHNCPVEIRLVAPNRWYALEIWVFKDVGAVYVHGSDLRKLHKQAKNL